MKETPINVKTELSNLGVKVLQLENEIESGDERRQIFFIGKQLMLFNRRSPCSDLKSSRVGVAELKYSLPEIISQLHLVTR